ncbi:hypothetical protein O181_008620 [Austropuccinia psidii MF-1]|uniref:Uncharacterized protein n=1 Tax=Austropuccinia psidii MF-1 TaxID=1389203 RepID=A0A9Q3BPQ3_9BASI|nr:hypothetical protein [Austropuccinia psidii MF-1]
MKNKNPIFPVSLIKSYQPADKEFFPSRNLASLTIPQVEHNEDKKIKEVLKERKIRGKIERIIRYRNPVHEDEWLEESDITYSDKLLRIFRPERMLKA